MKLWIQVTFYIVSILILSGCVSSPKPKKEAVIDETLPVVKLTKNGTFVDMNSLAFEWQSIKDHRVKGIYVYKLDHDSTNTDLTYYATIDSRFVTHFVDSNIKPDTQYSYYFQTYSKEAESKKSALITLNSLPVLESVSWIHSVQDMPRSAKIIWRPHTNQKVKSYIVERKTLEEDKWEQLAVINGRLNSEYIDEALKDMYTYKYRVKVLTFDNILSSPSESVKVVTKALPREVTNIVATTKLPRKIKVTWDASVEKDFLRYNLYRSENIKSSYELRAKIDKNEFIDEIEEDGKQYFYRVSAVDKDELESKYNEESIQGMTLSKPEAPSLVEAKLVENKVHLVWNNVDSRTKTYIVKKRSKKGWFNELIEEFEGLSEEKFIDKDIKPDTKYYYEVYSVDEHSIKSKPSIKVEFKSPPLPKEEESKDNNKNKAVTPAKDINKNEI